MDFSVVICTYQRADLLKIALQTLCAQTLGSTNYEVIVVDNNSTDHTASVAQEFVAAYPHVQYYYEARQGLSYARNTGWQVSSGTYIAYIDDECKVPPEWLSVAKHIVDESAPAILGGPFYGYYQQAPPHWWKELYGEFTHSGQAQVLADDENVSGGNFIVRRSLLSDLGGFDVHLGMNGNKIAYGEESDLQQRLRQQMPHEVIYYDPDLYLYHLIRPEKYSLWWLIKSRFSGGRDSYTVFSGRKVARDSMASLCFKQSVEHFLRLKLLLQAVRTVINSVRGVATYLVCGNRREHPFLQNYIYEETGEYAHQLGTIYEQLLKV